MAVWKKYKNQKEAQPVEGAPPSLCCFGDPTQVENPVCRILSCDIL